MKFKEIFDCFLERKDSLKVVYVASCDRNWKPNSAAKMLVEMIPPNEILFLDYKFTRTYANLREIPKLSLSFMDDVEFRGYRLTGVCTVMDSGEEFKYAQKIWERKLITYEADRIIQRVKGFHSTREGENSLPEDFVIVRFTATEAAVIKPDRIFKAHRTFTVLAK
ncbi:MAG: pyridoxamine 5'-phosphate oxidase family protein [Candidatus Omnitrophica bacterium]|nr:pyridoxamine 5'-phosphate oxidase family protein [Candidatus Omnitrophota bacterium]